MIDFRTMALYYLCSTAGLVMVVGGIWLLYKQKIFIDSESKQITEIELPGIGKFKTNLPALVLFAFGFVPLIVPLAKLPVLSRPIRLTGNLAKSDQYPVTVYAVVASTELRGHGPFRVSVPSLATQNENYQVLFVFGENIKAGSTVVVKTEDEIALPNDVTWEAPKEPERNDPARAVFKPDLQPIPPEFVSARRKR